MPTASVMQELSQLFETYQRQGDVLVPCYEPPVKQIREAARGSFLGIVEQFHQAAVAAFGRSSRLEQAGSERVMRIGVDYIQPDRPHAWQQFGLQREDFAVWVADDQEQRGAFINTLFPPLARHRHMSDLVLPGQKDVEPGRLVHTGLAKFVAHWLREIEGPLVNIYYEAARPLPLEEQADRRIVVQTHLLLN